MGRSLKKGVYVHPKLLKKVMKANEEGSKGPIKTWARASQIIPEMIGITFQVHNGRKFIDVTPVENMVGHRLGEFSPTRTFKGHGGKMAKDQAAAETASARAQVQAAQNAE